MALRNVTGIIRDSLNKPVAGAEVRLISAKDTLKAITNTYGFYGFPKVKSADFLLSIKALGHHSFNRKYFNNDTKTVINIPSIRLGIQEEQLETVTIKRLKGPTIKGDTTEFWAKDYIVRDYARLEDLLKRMEGVRIDPDGSLFYNNQIVAKALFNGTEYFSGSVKEAIKELPADIIERIQIIDMDESGFNAKKTKTENSTKVLNIVTKPDKSAGKTYDFTTEQGSQSRSRFMGKLKSIDQTNQFSAKLNYQQEPLGIRYTPIPGSISEQNFEIRNNYNSPDFSNGQLKKLNTGLGKSLKIKKLKLFTELNYAQTLDKHSRQTIGETYYEQGTLRKKTMQESDSKNHNLNSFTTFNFLGEKQTLMGNLRIDADKNESTQLGQNLQSGIINNLEDTNSKTNLKNLKYSLYSQYTRNFTKKLALSSNLMSSYNNSNSNVNSRTAIYKDTLNTVTADSILHQLQNLKTTNFSSALNNSLNWNYNKQLKFITRLGFTSNLNLNENKSFVKENETVNFNSTLSFFQNDAAYSVPVSFQTEYSLKNGITFSPIFGLTSKWLDGEVGLSKTSISRYDLLPETSFKIKYTSKIGNIEATIRQFFTQPTLISLNPIPNYRTPYNINIGNPDLKNSENLSYSFIFSNFFKKIQFNAYINYSYLTTKNGIGVITDSEIDPEKNTFTTTNTYSNIDGKKLNLLNFNFTKIFSKLNLQFNGTFKQSDNPYFLNSELALRKSLSQLWETNFIFNPKEWMEINGGLSYSSDTDHNTASTAKTYNQLFNATTTLKLFLGETWNINLYFQQNLNKTSNVANKMSPTILNMNIEKRIFKQKNGIISLVVMDLARQNYLLNYNSFDNGYQQTFTNKNSNYFILQFSWRPEFWGKSKFDKGNGRNGNGSFK
ncbi:TonB-dependent receptor [Flavobacterium crocinum]|uniref:TonB-dependent receptor n=1 Tax=Flavobacterium crocinum TaxID=2183896 RepID=UPI00142E6515|nr:TonB-dependent receptor [Flavobacterium crocinum]